MSRVRYLSYDRNRRSKRRVMLDEHYRPVGSANTNPKRGFLPDDAPIVRAMLMFIGIGFGTWGLCELVIGLTGG